jgi:hypothetical protein
MTDRRQAEDDSLDALAEHSAQSARRVVALQRWVKRMTWLLLALVATALATVIVGFLVAGKLYDQIGHDRYTAIVDLCELQNSQARGNITFISKVSPNLEAEAIRQFQVIPSCDRFARRTGASP